MKFRITKPAMEANGMFNPVTLTTPTRRSMLNAERFAETGPANWQVFYATLDDHPDTAPIPAPPVSNPMTQLFCELHLARHEWGNDASGRAGWHAEGVGGSLRPHPRHVSGKQLIVAFDRSGVDAN